MKQKLQSLVRKIFLSTGGGLRPGWRAALGVLFALAAYFAVLRGLAALFGALFDAWGLTTANLTRAPGWAQSVVRWHSDFCYALAYGAGIAAGILWARRFSAPTDGAAENRLETSARSLDAETVKSRHTSASGKATKACDDSAAESHGKAFARFSEVETADSRRFSALADGTAENRRETSAKSLDAEAANSRHTSVMGKTTKACGDSAAEKHGEAFTRISEAETADSRRFSAPADAAAENCREASARSLDAETVKSRHTSATAKTAKACGGSTAKSRGEAFTWFSETETANSRHFSVPADAAAENCREASAQSSNAEEINTRRMDTRKFTLFAAALGLAMGGGLGALALWTDSMRLQTPWRGPSIALAQLTALIVLALGRLLGEILTKRLCFDALRMRSRRAAWIVSVALATALNLRAISVLGVLNALLLSMVGCALYERGGLSASAVLQTVWTAAATLLFGFPGMSASASAVWPLYHVSDAWLTGGNVGPMGGAWFAMLLLAALLALLRRPLIDAIRRQMTRKTEK